MFNNYLDYSNTVDLLLKYDSHLNDNKWFEIRELQKKSNSIIK